MAIRRRIQIKAAAQAFSDAFTLAMKFAETANSVPTDIDRYAIALLQSDTNVAPTETVQLAFPAPDFGDTNVVPSETRSLAIRTWATGCTTNDAASGNTVAPANANGQNDGVFCNCTTGTGTADTTNPVTVTTGSMNVPGGLTIVSAKIRVWFKDAAVALVIAVGEVWKITATASGGFNQIIYAGPVAGTVAYPGTDHSTGDFTFDVSALTLAQLQSLVLTASYNAAVVLAPQDSLKVDAWAVDIVTTL